jgi:hypothetical protein
VLFFQAGGLLRPLPRLSLGAFVASGPRARVTGTYQSTTGVTTSGEERHIDLPAGGGLGAALLIGERWRLSGDLVWRGWDGTELDGVPLPRPGLGSFQNTLRWGVGLERLGSTHPRAGFLSTIAWRAGFTAIPWYTLDATGDEIREWRASAGFGLPVQRDRGSLDFVFAWGHRGARGENGVEEDFMRFGIGSIFSSVLREY